MAVLFMDLDGFKHVNDSMGHATGDELLVEVAVRLRICLRRGEIVARFGGGEFAVLLEGAGGEAGAVEVAGRIARGLSPSIDLSGKEV